MQCSNPMVFDASTKANSNLSETDTDCPAVSDDSSQTSYGSNSTDEAQSNVYFAKEKLLTIQHLADAKGYQDHCRDRSPDPNDDGLSRDFDMGTVQESKKRGHRPGAANLFPAKLHLMLSNAEADRFDHIVSWQPHGRCFKVHQPTCFVEDVLPNWFQQTKLASFQRQLCLYGFSRLSTGPDRGGYYHEKYLRGHYKLCCTIIRTRIKGTGIKFNGTQVAEPSFYKMTPCKEQARHTLQRPRALSAEISSGSTSSAEGSPPSNISLDLEEHKDGWEKSLIQPSPVDGIIQFCSENDNSIVQERPHPHHALSLARSIHEPFKSSTSSISLHSEDADDDDEEDEMHLIMQGECSTNRRSSAAMVYDSFQDSSKCLTLNFDEGSTERKSQLARQTSASIVRDSFIDPSICMSLASDQDLMEWNSPLLRALPESRSNIPYPDVVARHTPTIRRQTSADTMMLTASFKEAVLEEPLVPVSILTKTTQDAVVKRHSMVEGSRCITVSRCFSPWLSCGEEDADEEITYGDCQFHYLDPESLFGW